MKRFAILGGVLIVAFSLLSYLARAGGGDAFVGGMAGGMLGSAITSRPSGGGDGGGSRELSSRVDRLEDQVNRKFDKMDSILQEMDRRIRKFEK